MEDLIFFEIKPGFIIFNLLKAYGIPFVLYFVSTLFKTSDNELMSVLGAIGCVLISLWCIAIGFHILTEIGLIVSGLAGFVFGVMFLIGTFNESIFGDDTSDKIKLNAGMEENKKELQQSAGTNDSSAFSFYQTGRKYMNEGNCEEAKKHFQHAAEMGNKSAMSELAELFLEYEKYDEAEQWWRPLAEQGSAVAQYHLGELLYRLRKNDEADLWIEKSAKQNYHDAVELQKFNYMRIDEFDETS
ncbi:MAG: hypothetical protein LBP85_01315 [Prevotellaceae bacterium]|jgi:tetratricopeptide (TPR) repeat protein|nr:hypothetical protein [Prevotellaceae bacterium]